jgi:hypothetical protein
MKNIVTMIGRWIENRVSHMGAPVQSIITESTYGQSRRAQPVQSALPARSAAKHSHSCNFILDSDRSRRP